MMKKKNNWYPIYFIAMFLTGILHEIFNSGGISYYFVHTLGMSVKSQAILLNIYAPISAVLMIVCGIVVDRYKGVKEGRRIPFIRIFGVLEGLLFIVIFSLPPSFVSNYVGVFYLTSLLSFVICYNFEGDANFAIPSEEISDSKERSKVYIITGIISASAMLIQNVAVTYLQVVEGQRPGLFRLFIIVFSSLMAITCLIESFKLPHNFSQDEKAIDDSKAISSFLECFKNKTFLIGEVYLTLVVVSVSVVLFGIFYYFAEVHPFNIMEFILFPVYALMAIGLYRYLSNRIDRKYIFAIFSFIPGIGLICTFLLGSNKLAAIPFSISLAFLMIVQFIFNNFIIIDAVEADAKISGIRKEAQYLAIDYVLDTIGVYGKSLFLLIIMHYGYVESLPPGSQSILAQKGILIGCMLIPAILLLIATAAIGFYPRDQKSGLK